VVAACSGEKQLYPELLEQSAGIAGSASVFDAGREPASGVVIEMISVGSGADQAPETGVTGSALLLRNGELLYWGIGGDDGPARGFGNDTATRGSGSGSPAAKSISSGVHCRACFLARGLANCT
jgi:hypothetical protein